MGAGPQRICQEDAPVVPVRESDCSQKLYVGETRRLTTQSQIQSLLRANPIVLHRVDPVRQAQTMLRWQFFESLVGLEATSKTMSAKQYSKRQVQGRSSRKLGE